jgi:hypothetical protein
MHFDPFYMIGGDASEAAQCEPFAVNRSASDAGLFGNYNCSAPWRTVIVRLLPLLLVPVR